jgi:hypothetical protein
LFRASADRRTGADHHRGIVGDRIHKRLGDPLAQLGGDAIGPRIAQETLIHQVFGRDARVDLGQQLVEGGDMHRRGMQKHECLWHNRLHDENKYYA